MLMFCSSEEVCQIKCSDAKQSQFCLPLLLKLLRQIIALEVAKLVTRNH
ncbi:MAG: hypothetical protein ACI88A_000925 [Paraglaciecola sp.]|jgi:hypothetical protein